MIQFRKFQEHHLGLLKDWLQQEHVKIFWQETEDVQKLKNKFLNELPQRAVSAFVIEIESTPIGYIQYYECSKIGGGWWPQEQPGTFGIDLMIGNTEFLGKGLGVQIIRDFIDYVKTREPKLTSLIIDPDPKNTKAIHVFKKAGFAVDKEITTPGGQALLMRIAR